MKPYRFKYMPYLNGLRGVAALSVLTQHGLGPFSAWLVGQGSWTAMDLFFVLSGFLIISLLFQEVEDTGHVNILNFYARRTLRIWPGHFAFLFLTILINPYNCRSMLIPAICTATFMSDYATAFNWGGIILSGLVQTWSVSVEEKFYALSPLLLGVFRAHTKKILIGSLISCELWKVFLITQGVPWVRLQACFDTQMDGVILGSLAGLFIAEQKTRDWLKEKISWPIIPVTLAILLVVMNSKMAHPDSLQTLTAQLLFWPLFFPAYKALLAVLICCLFYHRNSIVTKVLELKALCWIGTVSYGVYLWHGFAFRLVGRHLIFLSLPYLPAPVLTTQNLPYVVEAEKLIVALAFGALSFYLMENPFLKLKRRFEPPRPPKTNGSPDLSTGKVLV